MGRKGGWELQQEEGKTLSEKAVVTSFQSMNMY
jgi:hypothetical protein